MSEFKPYIDAVLKGVKIDSISRKDIADEIEDHLNLLKQQYLSSNFTEEVAAEMAMKSFGEVEDIRSRYDLVLNPFNKLYIRVPAIMLFMLYMFCFLALFVFFESHVIVFPYYRLNIVPFKTIMDYLLKYDALSFKFLFNNLLGMVIAFIPFGFLMPIIHNGVKRIYHVFIASILFSLLIEVLQLVTKRGVADIDDIILNTIGGILGFVLLNLLVRFLFFLKKMVLNINIFVS
jgi:glycopeptide antibiotics resistance protein